MRDGTYRRYVLYKHNNLLLCIFLSKKEIYKERKFSFFIAKISDFGVIDEKIARIFDSLHLLSALRRSVLYPRSKISKAYRYFREQLNEAES